MAAASLDFETVVKSIAGNTLTGLLPLWMRNWSQNITPARLGDSLDKLYSRPPSERVLIVGRGPSIHKHGHLEMVKRFPGHVIASDGALPLLTERGVVPYLSMTVDGNEVISKWFKGGPTTKLGSQLQVVLPLTVHPKTVAQCRSIRAHIYWYIPELDQEPIKGLTEALQLQTYSTANPTGISRANGAGNCGLAAIVLAASILRTKEIILIGMDGGYPPDTPLEQLHYHGSLMKAAGYNEKQVAELYRMYHHPDLGFCVVDPIFEVYRNTALMLGKATQAGGVKLINATEGGCIFGEGIEIRRFDDYLATFK